MRQLVTRIMIVALLLSILPFYSAAAATANPEEVSRIAKSYIGVPYKFGGTTPAGFDCSGFVGYVYDQVGISLPRTSSDQYNTGSKVSKADLVQGDLVFFQNTYNKAGITHSGIYLGNNEFISATSSKGIKIDSLSSSYWGPKFYGATRVIQRNPGEYYDVDSSNPAYQAITSLSNQGVVSGYENGYFRPDDNVTRAQAAAIMNRVLKKEPQNLNAFTDVPATDRFAKDIAAIKELGVIKGFADGTFRPDANMTRAEMAVILQRAFDLEGRYTIASNNYSDVDPSFWAYDAIVTMSSIDTTTVFSGDQYYASNNATRAVFSAAIYNTLNVK